jgi:plastocyanin
VICVRRHLLRLGGAVVILRTVPSSAEAPVTIRMRSDEDGANVGFDPVGLLIQPGQTVRFHCEANYHTTAAYHPDNGNHSLRIPDTARPWSSEVLQPGEDFQVTLTVPGVYDYFCAPHEAAGMVGRLIVGQPTGPGSRPFDWYSGSAEAKDWVPVPEAARAVFPPVAEIMQRGSVPGRMIGMVDWPSGSLLGMRMCVSRRDAGRPGIAPASAIMLHRRVPGR